MIGGLLQLRVDDFERAADELTAEELQDLIRDLLAHIAAQQVELDAVIVELIAVGGHR